MSKKEQQLLLFNQLEWEWVHLSETCLLISTHAPLCAIQESAGLIKEILGPLLQDIVPAYHSIAIFTDIHAAALLNKLENVGRERSGKPIRVDCMEVPVCYELGPDLSEVAKMTGFSEEEVIALHQSRSYESVLIGFTPGFIYMEGLNEKLACPRKANPRTKVHAGSVGIGGRQTGIYSLDSPGGWNIIGRTPILLFDPKTDPPIRMKVGTKVTFKRISSSKFNLWEN